MITSGNRVLGCLKGHTIGDAFGYTLSLPNFKNTMISNLTSLSATMSSQSQLLGFSCEALINSHTSGFSSEETLGELKYGLDCWAKLHAESFEHIATGFSLIEAEAMKAERYSERTTIGCYRNGNYSANNDSREAGALARIVPVALYYAYDMSMSVSEISGFCAKVSKLTHGHELSSLSAYFFGGLITRMIRYPGESLRTLIENSLEDVRTAELISENNAAMFIKQIEDAIILSKSNETDQDCIKKLEADGFIDNTVAVSIYMNLKYSYDFNTVFLTSIKYSKNKAAVASLSCSLAGLLTGERDINPVWCDRIQDYWLLEQNFKHIVIANRENSLIREYFSNQVVNAKINLLRKKWKSNIDLVFLDFDGVFFMIGKREEEYLERIANLCKEYNLFVVISSSWRRRMNLCERILADYDLRIIGRTTLDGYDRNEQIIDYLTTHPFRNFIVIDDCELKLLKDYQVKTDSRDGFTKNKYNEAKLLLNRQLAIHGDKS